MAMFGPALLAFAPSISDSTFWRGAMVFLTVAMFKVPLMLIFFSIIRRNREWPGQPVKWSNDEITEILEALRARMVAANRYPDSEARLQRLSTDAWHVADQLNGPRQVDALTIALQIDEKLMALRQVSSRTDQD